MRSRLKWACQMGTIGEESGCHSSGRQKEKINTDTEMGGLCAVRFGGSGERDREAGERRRVVETGCGDGRWRRQ